MATDGGTRNGHGEDTAKPAASAYLDLAAELARSQSRHLLDLATGVLVAQQTVEPAVAAQTLSALAAGAGLSVAELAADIVNGACGVDSTISDSPDAVPLDPRTRRQLASAAEAGGDLDEVTTALLGGLRPLGVRGLLVWRRTASDCLHLVGAAGFSPLDRAQWAQIPPQWRALPQRAVSEARPIWLPNGVEDPGELPGPSRDAARALLPLRSDGHIGGAVLVTWRGPMQLGAELRLRVASLLEVLARVIAGIGHAADPGASLPVLSSTLDLLGEPAMTLRKALGGNDEEPPQLYVEHMNSAAQRMSSGVPRPVGRPLAHVLPTVADELTALVAEAYRNRSVRRAPRLPDARHPATPPLLNVRALAVSADRCIVLWHGEERDHSFSVLERAGHMGSLAAFEDDTARGVTQWSEQVAPLLGLPATADPVPLEQLSSLVATRDRAELTRMLDHLTTRLEGVSGVVRIPRPDGGVRYVRIIAEPLLTAGTLTGLTGFFQDVSARHQTEAALAATFDTLGTVQQQAALRHRLALQLQQAIVPEQTDLGTLPGLQVAARYRPAAEEYRVGGDWYDVLSLPDHRVMIAVGDVAGHGIDAATGMVALRNALRGLACSGMDPGPMMHALNEVAMRTNGHPTATAVCSHFDPAERILRWTSAGHLPAMLLRGGRSQLLESAPNLLLGAVPGTGYAESQVALQAGDLLLLFTDGLIERRHASLDEALDMLGRVVDTLDANGDLEAQADILLAEAVGDTDDDASLVLLRLA